MRKLAPVRRVRVARLRFALARRVQVLEEACVSSRDHLTRDVGEMLWLLPRMAALCRNLGQCT